MVTPDREVGTELGLSAAPARGTLPRERDEAGFTPAANFTGRTQFTVYIQDSNGRFDTQVITVGVGDKAPKPSDVGEFRNDRREQPAFCHHPDRRRRIVQGEQL